MEGTEILTVNPINIGYYDPFGVFLAIEGELKSLLPLKSLRWKYHPAKPLKSIDTLPLHFNEEIPKRLSQASSASQPLNESTTHVRLMFVQYADMGTYRSQVRPLIKEWLKSLVVASNSNWMLVYYAPPNLKDKQSSMMKRSGFEKLKLDFDAGGKELESLTWTTETQPLSMIVKFSQHPSLKTQSFDDLTLGFKSLIIDSFDKQLQSIDLSSKSQKNSDKIANFLSKLSLARLLRDMRVLRDSMDLYTELTSDIDVLYAADSHCFDEALDISLADCTGMSDPTAILAYLRKLEIQSDGKLFLFNLRSLIFANTISIFEVFIEQSNSNNARLALIDTMLGRLISFLNELSQSYDESGLEQLIYVLADHYITTSMLFEISPEDLENPDTLRLMGDICGLRGELRLIQRSQLCRLGKSKGFAVSRSLTGDLLSLLLAEKSSALLPFTVSQKVLTEALSSFESYKKRYWYITELVLRDYLNSGRTNSVDVLSIELALAKHENGEFNEALDIIGDSYEFFFETQWSFMGGFVLELRVMCLEMASSSLADQLVSAYFNLLEALGSRVKRVETCINSYASTKLPRDIATIFSKIMSRSLDLTEPLIFPAAKFTKFDIKPCIKADESCPFDQYIVEVDVSHDFPSDLPLRKVLLELKNVITGEIETFSATNVVIPLESSHLVCLYSTRFHQGRFIPFKMTLELTEKLFLQDDACVLQGSVTPFSFELDPTKFWCELSCPSKIDLKATAVKLRLITPHNLIEKCVITSSPVTEGLKLDEQSLHSVIPQIEAGHSHEMSIPYIYDGGASTISINFSVEYEVNQTKYHYQLTLDADVALKISVSVHDLFKTDFVYSKFAIRPPDHTLPLEVVSTSLQTSSPAYKISLPRTTPSALVAHAGQPCTLLYQISPDPAYCNDLAHVFNLTVEYIHCRDECSRAIDVIVSKTLETDRRLLRDWHLIKRTLLLDITIDFSRFCSARTICILDKAKLSSNISSQVEAVSRNGTEKQKLLEVLTDVLIDQRDITVEEYDIVRQEIKIAVTMPVLDFLHVLEYDFDRKVSYLVGEPIVARLRIKLTARWKGLDLGLPNDGSFLAASSPTRSTIATASNTIRPLPEAEFLLSIGSDDCWIVSGFCKSTFAIKNGKDNKAQWQLVLIPLSVGKICLPTLDIRHKSDANFNKSMEVDRVNGLESILVVSDVDTRTFNFESLTFNSAKKKDLIR